MLVGVVSDTHNNIKSIKSIIDIFNKENVDYVIHTGDISNALSLRKFSELNCQLLGVFGNNDRNEGGLKEVCEEFNFLFREPPFLINLLNRKIAIFHEPDSIDDYLIENRNIDLVLFGHTHRYTEETKNKVVYFNPGESAGFFRGKNAVGIVDLNNLEIRRIFF